MKNKLELLLTVSIAIAVVFAGVALLATLLPKSEAYIPVAEVLIRGLNL